MVKPLELLYRRNSTQNPHIRDNIEVFLFYRCLIGGDCIHNLLFHPHTALLFFFLLRLLANREEGWGGSGEVEE